MGGPGSGRWYRWDGKKPIVEESLTLDIKGLPAPLDTFNAGTFTWTWANGQRASVDYFLVWDAERPILTLEYRWRDVADIRVPIPLQATHPALGGLRWWFTCPLVVDGVPCNRRVGKLYLPPGARYFGCRHCHNLTYRSSQEAHQAERVAAMLGLDGGIGRLLDSRRGRNRVR